MLSGLGAALAPVVAAAAPARVTADEFWAGKNGVRLWVYRKRAAVGAPPVPTGTYVDMTA